MTSLIRIDRGDGLAGLGRDGGRPSLVRFCSRCGLPSEEPPERPLHRRRVCERCGMGVMLTCSRDALPGEAGAFLIVTADLRVSAVSAGGERIFGDEDAIVGLPLHELLGSPLGDDQLTRHVALAADRSREPLVMPVRLAARERAASVGTMAARIATCGPPRAALVTVEPSDFGRR